jgi:hypothetical protein
MEGQILETLGFNLTKVTPVTLLSAHQQQLQPKNMALAKFVV